MHFTKYLILAFAAPFSIVTALSTERSETPAVEKRGSNPWIKEWSKKDCTSARTDGNKMPVGWVNHPITQRCYDMNSDALSFSYYKGFQSKIWVYSEPDCKGSRTNLYEKSNCQHLDIHINGVEKIKSFRFE